MASVTLTTSDEMRNQLKRFQWVNWSEIAREETMKKLIFEDYIKTGTISDEEWEFCERIDWHPADELPFKEEYIKKVKAAKRGKPIKIKSVSDIFK